MVTCPWQVRYIFYALQKEESCFIFLLREKSLRLCVQAC